jgi:hypothetical protein
VGSIGCPQQIIKGIFQPFELGGVTRLIRSAVKFWKAGNFKKKFNKLVRLNDFYDDFVQPKSLSAIFLDSGKSPCISYKMTKDSHRILSSPRIPEDDLPGPGRFRLTTSRNRPGPDSNGWTIPLKDVSCNLTRGRVVLTDNTCDQFSPSITYKAVKFSTVVMMNSMKKIYRTVSTLIM